MSQAKTATANRYPKAFEQFDVMDHIKPMNEKTAKRAEWENFSVRVLSDGKVLVVNKSHAEPAEHAYLIITDQEGIPKWCLRVLSESHDDDWEDCPACAYHCDNSGDTEELVANGEYEVDKHMLAYARNDAMVRLVRAIKNDEIELDTPSVHDLIGASA